MNKQQHFTKHRSRQKATEERYVQKVEEAIKNREESDKNLGKLAQRTRQGKASLWKRMKNLQAKSAVKERESLATTSLKDIVK
jgi:hypothetical protein